MLVRRSMHLPYSKVPRSILAFGDPAVESASTDTEPVLLSLEALTLVGCGGLKRRVTGVAGVTSDVN